VLAALRLRKQTTSQGCGVLTVRRSDSEMKRKVEIGLPMKLNFFLWERHLAAMIVAGSHSHKGDTSLPIGRRSAP